VNINRLGPRRIDDRDRQRGRRGAPPPPGKAPDRTGLYVGLGVGGVALILLLAYAMSSGGTGPARVDRSTDKRVKEDMEAAIQLWNGGKTREAITALDAVIANGAYKKSTLLDQARNLVAEYRKQIAFEDEAREGIAVFAHEVETARNNQTAMQKAEALWAKSEDLLKKWGSSRSARDLQNIREDLRRWRATSSQDAWQEDYNRTKGRIKTQHLDTGNFSTAIKEWNQFVQPFEDAQLKAKVTSELTIIDNLAKEAATKLVNGVGSDAKARATLDEALPRFVGTEGQKIILQKLKTIPH
jgi:hypothetical protein